MEGSGAVACRGFLRRATGCAALLSISLLTITSDFLHHHPGDTAGTKTLTRALPGARLAPAQRPATPHRSVPCLACLHHRTHFVPSQEKVPDGHSVEVCRDQAVPPLPPSVPTISQADLRAPPCSC